MTRKNLFLIIIAFIVGVSVWIFFVSKTLKKTQDVIVEQVTQSQRRVASVPPKAAPDNSVVKNQLQAEIQALQQQIRLEKQKLDSQKMTIDKIKNQQGQQQEQQSPAAISSEIRARTSEIQDFLDELKNYQYAEQDINRRATEALREQSSAAQMARDQIDENIRAQEALIRQTQEQIAYWQRNWFYLDEREARLQDLGALLQVQTGQLQGMRDQRLAISARVLENTQNLQNQKEQALSDLANSRGDLQGEIASLRTEINRLQGVQFQTRSSQISLRSQANQMQKDFDAQNQQIQNLESSMQEKERQLKLLQ